MASKTLPQHTAETYPFEAEGRGLSGHAFRCSCGEVQRTSLSEAEARRMADAHLAWHRTVSL